MKKGLSAFAGSVTITSTMLGVGINFMPAAFRSIGYFNSILCMAFISFLTGHTLFTVGYAAHVNKSPSKSYSSIAYDLHTLFGYVVDFSIVFSQFFVGLAFHKYMVDLLILFAFGVNDTHKSYNVYRICGLLGTGSILYFLSLLKDLSSLAFTSYLSVFSVVYLTILMLFFNLYLGTSIQEGGFDSTNTSYGFGLQYFILGMCCQVNMVSVYSELTHRTAKGLVFIAAVSSVLGGIIYSSVGYLGYRLFGNMIGEEDIIKQFCNPSSSINQALKDQNMILRFAPKIAVFGALVVLFGSFPLQLNPASSILLKIFKRDDDRTRKLLITGLFSTMLFINFIPNLKLSTFLGILGGVFSNSISFLFPSLFYICAVRRVNILSILSIGVIIFSICAGAYILKTILSQP